MTSALQEDFLRELSRFQGQLTALAARNLPAALLKRISAEDAVQETFLAAAARRAFFERSPEVPLYFKLRKLLLQTCLDLTRKHLGAQKRDLYREVDLPEGETTSQPAWENFISAVTGPLTVAARNERHALLYEGLNQLGENDRQIIEMRHFDELTNEACAELLEITPKAASIRYVRALERLQKALLKFTEFGNG